MKKFYIPIDERQQVIIRERERKGNKNFSPVREDLVESRSWNPRGDPGASAHDEVYNEKIWNSFNVEREVPAIGENHRGSLSRDSDLFV